MRRRCLVFLSIIRTEFVLHIKFAIRVLDWAHTNHLVYVFASSAISAVVSMHLVHFHLLSWSPI